MLTRELPIEITKVNEKDRMIDVVWSTGADVRRRGFFGGDQYIERLSMSPSAVDLSRFNGAPVLNSHQQDDVLNVFGMVVNPTINNGRGLAQVIFDEDEDSDKVFGKVKRGFLNQWSIGYSVEENEEIMDADGMLIRTAIKWTPLELSTVTIGADPGARTGRSADSDIEEEIRKLKVNLSTQVLKIRKLNDELKELNDQLKLERDIKDNLINAYQLPIIDVGKLFDSI